MEWNTTWEFALFSANLHRYLPEIPWTEHPQLYQQYTEYHQPRLSYDRSAWETTVLAPYTTTAPRILCLYHLGYHAQLPRVLADKGLCFDVLMDRKVFEEQRDLLDHLRDDMNSNENTYRFLFSDNPAVLLQVRTTLQQGRHLVVFADGNSGTDTAMANRQEVDFLNSRLAVRKGIALISHLMMTPVIPISHRVQGQKIQLVLGEAIFPANTPRKEYIGACMQTLYGFLSRELAVQPWLWECWSYLHELNAFEPEADERADRDIVKPEDALLPISIAGQMGYFDRLRYLFCYEMRTQRK